MGQYWMIVNLDKRQTYGRWGKLGEFFFDGESPSNISLGLWPRRVSDRDTLIPHFKPGDVYGKRCVYGPWHIPQTAPRSLDATAFVNLPAEIIHEIFSYIGDLCDLLSLGLACQVLWAIGREHIHRQIASLVAEYSWVGDRILCVGDHLKNKDIPEALWTPSERAKFLDSGRTLYRYPFVELRPTFDQGCFLSWGGIWERFVLESCLLDEELALVTELFDGPDFAPLQAVNPVLRNLSRSQYVLESALVDLMVIFPKVGLGEVILSRICLSSDPSTAMLSGDRGGMHRGVWAGDRFDIVDEGWLKELGDDESWTDVSKEVMKEMERVCLLDYPYELKEHRINRGHSCSSQT
ncbi:hypothetical protein DFH06DRAFT_1178568 [Mycena polygramma]|nr:hypothetical protein DFH06DRAFT_1178568 [Mycena polygramma]